MDIKQANNVLILCDKTFKVADNIFELLRYFTIATWKIITPEKSIKFVFCAQNDSHITGEKSLKYLQIFFKKISELICADDILKKVGRNFLKINESRDI